MIDYIKKCNWLERALKTFVETFFSVLIPMVAGILTGEINAETSAVVFPTLCASLGYAISAAWNIIQDNLKERNEEKENG